MSKNCIITTVKSKIKGNATSYIEKENEIIIPVSKKFTLAQTRAMAQDKVNKINKEYLSEKFGNVVSLNTSYTDGTGINIHPPQLLIDAYEVKEGNKTLEEINSNRDLEYFNGDEALLEQEQNEDNLIQKELDNLIEQTNNIEENAITTPEIKEGVDFVFEQNPELSKIGTQEQYSQYLESLSKPNTNPILQGNQQSVITSNDKIIWGHPGIGKTFLHKQGKDDIIDFDSVYKSRINKELGLPEGKDGWKFRNEWRKTHEEEWKQKVRQLWKEAKEEAKETGKQLFASDIILLREFVNDFDKVITMSKETFVNRAKQRNDYTPGEAGTEGWKNNIDIEIDKIDKSKVITTDKYLSDLLSNVQQEQVKKFTELQERLNNEEFLEGAKSAYESTPDLQQFGTQEEYNDYIARVSLGIIKNPTSGDYNYTSQVKDIVYHGTYQDFEGFDKEKLGSTTGSGKYINKKTNEEIPIDSSFAFFFTNKKLNASAYSYKGRANKINETLYHLSSIAEPLYKSQERINESIKYLKSIPFFNNLIETAKSEGKSSKDISELLRLEYVKFYKKTKDSSFDRFTNWQVNNHEDKEVIKNFKQNIDKFLAGNPDIQNRFGNFEQYSSGLGNYFNLWYDKDTKQYTFLNSITHDRFTSKEATKERLNKFFDDALIEINKSEQERISEMKSLGYQEKIKPAVINLKNPLVHDYEKSAFPDTYKGQLRKEEGKKEVETAYIAARQTNKALKEGNDGVIYENIVDPLESNSYGVFDANNIHTLGSKTDIEGFKEFVSKKINNIKADESINERLKKYEESIKIPNNVKSKVLEKIEKETEKLKEKLLSLGFKQEDSKFEFFTNSYTTFKMKLKELDNLNVNLTTNKGDDFYQINARLKTIDSTLELKKQGELPFTPIEVKQTIQEKEFLDEVSDNVFEGLSEEEKQILKKKIENGDYDLNCKI